MSESQEFGGPVNRPAHNARQISPGEALDGARSTGAGSDFLGLNEQLQPQPPPEQPAPPQHSWLLQHEEQPAFDLAPSSAPAASDPSEYSPSAASLLNASWREAPPPGRRPSRVALLAGGAMLATVGLIGLPLLRRSRPADPQPSNAARSRTSVAEPAAPKPVAPNHRDSVAGEVEPVQADALLDRQDELAAERTRPTRRSGDSRREAAPIHAPPPGDSFAPPVEVFDPAGVWTVEGQGADDEVDTTEGGDAEARSDGLGAGASASRSALEAAPGATHEFGDLATACPSEPQRRAPQSAATGLDWDRMLWLSQDLDAAADAPGAVAAAERDAFDTATPSEPSSDDDGVARALAAWVGSDGDSVAAQNSDASLGSEPNVDSREEQAEGSNDVGSDATAIALAVSDWGDSAVALEAQPTGSLQTAAPTTGAPAAPTAQVVEPTAPEPLGAVGDVGSQRQEHGAGQETFSGRRAALREQMQRRRARQVSEAARRERAAAAELESAQAPAPAAPATSESTPTEQAPTEQTPTEHAPTEHAPTEHAPTEHAPTEHAPTEHAPTEQAPTEQAPTEHAPTEQAPTEQAPTEQAPTEQAPTEQAPTEQAPTEQAPTEQTPTEQAPTEQAPTEQAPTEQAPTEQAPTEQAPTEQAPTEQTPTEQAPTGQTPTEQTPTEQAPTAQTPTAQTPTEQAPTEQAPTEQAPTWQAPTEQAPTEQAPTGQTPTGQAPIEQAPIEQAPIEQAPVAPQPVEPPSATTTDVAKAPIVVESGISTTATTEDGETAPVEVTPTAEAQATPRTTESAPGLPTPGEASDVVEGPESARAPRGSARPRSGVPVVGPVPPNRRPRAAGEHKSASTQRVLQVATERDLEHIWTATEVPLSEAQRPTRLVTPNVGRARVVFLTGEIFEGDLVAVGQQRVWLRTKSGELGLEAARVGSVVRITPGDSPALGAPGSQKLAGLQRARVKAPGGVLTGRIIEQDAERTTLITDAGARIVLRSREVEVLGAKPAVQIRP